MAHTHATTRPHGHPSADVQPENQDPTWHCGHYYYQFERSELLELDEKARYEGLQQWQQIFDKQREGSPIQLQSFLVSGQKADFGIMALDPDPLAVDRVHQDLMASELGIGLLPAYSFVSMTEVSEYLPTPEQFVERLSQTGADMASEQTVARINAYQERWPIMKKERLTPDLPDWPAMCFYPMNKKRKVGENWFTLDLAERQRMMSEHGKSGMAFAGRVTQLITVSVGLDDWEWGVTLWAKKPEYLKEIVYKMRFDEASARYAEFGSFYTGYLADAEAILRHVRLR